MKRQGCIYLITNKINGKKYIGSTINVPSKRWREHRYLSKNGSNCYFHKAIRKYGENNFTIKEICTILNKNDIEKIELYFINLFNTLHPFGYNTADPERWEKLSEHNSKFMLEQWSNPEIRSRRLAKKYESGASQAIPIVAVSIYNGEVIFYDRVHDAGRAGFSISSIYSCLNEKVKTGQKYCWFYKINDDPSFYKNKALELLGEFKEDFLKPIIGTNIETGKQEFFRDCEELAAKGWQVKAVRRVLRGQRNSYLGYYWRYK